MTTEKNKKAQFTTQHVTHWKNVTLAAMDAFEYAERWTWNAALVASWLVHQGPIRIRFQWHAGMQRVKGTDPATVDVVGEKQGRVTCALVGFDGDKKDYPFRLLTPFGAAYGDQGRVWLSWDGITRLLREGAVVSARKDVTR